MLALDAPRSNSFDPTNWYVFEPFHARLNLIYILHSTSYSIFTFTPTPTLYMKCSQLINIGGFLRNTMVYEHCGVAQAVGSCILDGERFSTSPCLLLMLFPTPGWTQRYPQSMHIPCIIILLMTGEDMVWQR